MSNLHIKPYIFRKCVIQKNNCLSISNQLRKFNDDIYIIIMIYLLILEVKYYPTCRVSPYDNTQRSSRVESMQCWVVVLSHFHECSPHLLLLTWVSKSTESQPGDPMTYIVKNHQLNVLSWLESKHILAKIHRQSSKQLTEKWESRPKTQSNVFQEDVCQGLKLQC